MIPVSEGSAVGNTVFTLTNANPIVLGTTNLAFAALSGLRSTATPSTIVPATASNPGVNYRWASIDHSHAFPAPNPSLNDFRLSGSASSSPSDYVASTQIFLAGYAGNRIALYFGSAWYVVTLSSAPSLNLSGLVAGTPADVFAVQTSLTALTLETVNWTNASTRATALTLQDGVWVKSGSVTRRYLGTILPDSATTYSHVTSASDTSSPVCGIWNQNNRIRGAFSWTPTFDSWTIPSANTWQSLNGQASAKVQYVQGQSIDIVSAEHIGATDGTGGGALGIGIDSTTTPSGTRSLAANTAVGSVHARLRQVIVAGAHNLNAIANGGTAARFYGAHAPMLGSITAELWY
jgi:hypothetical protein